MSYQNVSHCHQIGLFKTALSHTIMLCDMKLWSKSYKPLPVRPHKFRLHGLILSDWLHRLKITLYFGCCGIGILMGGVLLQHITYCMLRLRPITQFSYRCKWQLLYEYYSCIVLNFKLQWTFQRMLTVRSWLTNI